MPAVPPKISPDESPRGFASLDERPDVSGANSEHLPIEDRWRIGMPKWRRYASGSAETPGQEGAWWNPYDQSVLKADYPILGDAIFLDLTVISDTIAEARSSPVPSGNSTHGARDEEFFGDFDQLFFTQSAIVSLELFHGDTSFRPKTWALRATPVFNFNYVDLQENGGIDTDVRDGTNRDDMHVGMQELFAEIHLLDLSSHYDFLTATLGIQPFNSDFRGFLFTDNNLGARLQANFLANRVQANVAYFEQLEKDTNSGLNTFDARDQSIFLANVFMQDFIFEGYTLLASWHWNHDKGGTQYDTNDFLVRPAKIGQVSPGLGAEGAADLNAHYLGIGGDGHLGPVNVSHQYYLALGRDDRNEIAGRSQQIQAHFFAAEVSTDIDWLRVKGSFLYASGDKDPTNGTAGGFSAISENPFFAGSGFSYFNRQTVPLVQTGVNLTNRLSLLPDLRTSKTQGRSNFVNPGLFLYGVGASAKVTPKVFLDANVNLLRFADTSSLEYLEQQNGIDRSLGVDYSLGVQWRPLLVENVILTGGVGFLTPLEGFGEIYRDQTLYSAFISATLTY